MKNINFKTLDLSISEMDDACFFVDTTKYRLFNAVETLGVFIAIPNDYSPIIALKPIEIINNNLDCKSYAIRGNCDISNKIKSKPLFVVNNSGMQALVISQIQSFVDFDSNLCEVPDFLIYNKKVDKTGTTIAQIVSLI